MQTFCQVLRKSPIARLIVPSEYEIVWEFTPDAGPEKLVDFPPHDHDSGVVIFCGTRFEIDGSRCEINLANTQLQKFSPSPTIVVGHTHQRSQPQTFLGAFSYEAIIMLITHKSLPYVYLFQHREGRHLKYHGRR